MEPHQGAGAGQAIEVCEFLHFENRLADCICLSQDAYLLAMLLGQRCTTLGYVHHALQVYDTIRRPFANDIASRNRLTGRQLMLRGGTLDWNSCTEDALKSKLQELGNAIASNWEWAWQSTIDGVLEEAIGKT